MRRLGITLTICLAVLALCAPAANAEFGLYGFDVEFTEADGSPAVQAGTHPFAMTTSFGVNFAEDEKGIFPEALIKDIFLGQAPGLVADATALPRCAFIDFLEDVDEDFIPDCPLQSQVGITASSSDVLQWRSSPVFTLIPPPGVVLRLGWGIAGSANVVVDVGVNPDSPHNGFAASRNTPQTVDVIGVKTQLWGDPTDPRHDGLRGPCLKERNETLPLEDVEGFQFESTGETCPVARGDKPLLTLPTYCGGSLLTSYEAVSWNDLDKDGKADTDAGQSLTPALSFCGALPAFDPSITAEPTSKAASSPSGLDFSLEIDDEGLTSNEEGARAKSQIRKVEVTLPEGFTTNPAIAEGLEVCSEAQLAKETAFSAPGAGCPSASKIGTVEVETPLLDERVNGALFIARPYENRFGSLLALYLVIKNAKLGIVVKQALRVIPDPETGQLTTVTEDIPQLPFSSFRLHFREGARSPLATPPRCGSHTVVAKLTPWSGGAPVTSTSSFEIISGPNEGPCPTGGLPPFRPGLLAGTTNNRAGSYSPFNLRLSRTDSEQEFTRFSIKLPPGITGKLAGIPFCPDASIEAAKQRSGTEEEFSPSCPAASEVGSTLAGAGVGPTPAYAPGKIYLAGPYNGSALSIAAITAAKVGPFDLGTVVVRQALKIDRNTAEVFIDATGSDPIPHIIDGIQVHARDIRAFVDKPEFVLNPTSCERTSTASTLLGSGLDFASEADNNPVVVSSPFQAADCAALPFDPKLSFSLIGGTKRGAHPRLRAVLHMRPGQANIAKARVTLPRSAFLDQSHIGTVCTRVQYAAKQCPPASIYGYAKAITPLFETPVEGPVYLRSSSNKLPDLVAALANGKIEFDLVGRIDSLKGRIRNSFDFVPDAPVSEAIFSFQGGNKGLIVNSTNLCKGTHKAIAEFEGHNGMVKNFRPIVEATKCKGKGKRAARHARTR